MEKKENGISVYTRYAEGLEIKEFRAVMTVKSNVNSIEKILDDYKKYPKWQENLTKIEIVKKISAKKIYLHFFTDIGWPIDNRDVVSLMMKKTSNDRKIITYKYRSVPNYIPRTKNYLRIKKTTGFWKIEKKENGRVKVIYQFIANPGGSIPTWLINTFLIDGPFKTMSNLKKMI